MNDTKHCTPKFRRMFSVALALLVFSPLVSAEPLGRLFLSPERRSFLEHQRQHNTLSKDVFADDTLRLNGIVRHSSGKATVWVNGQVQHADGGNTGIVIRPSPGEPGRVLLGIGGEAPVSLRVGETLNRTTREKADALAGGQVCVSSSHAEKPVSHTH